MAQTINIQDQIIDLGLDPNGYDLLKNLVQSKVEDAELVNEYIGAYAQVAVNLNMSIPAFVEFLQQQGTTAEQDIFLAGYLNQTRVANSKIGVLLNLNTPTHILREIRA
jgi:hypothetical protein